MKRPKVVLLWRSLGPYHRARAQAAAQRLAEGGLALAVVEISDRESTHAWKQESSEAPYSLHTLATGSDLSKGGNATSALRRLLDDLRPIAVAVAGYDRPEMRHALRWARRNGAVTLLMTATKWDDRSRSWLRLAAARRIALRVDAALVSGAPAGEYAVALGVPRERVFRQYGSVDNEFFAAAAARESPRGSERPYFLACARLVEYRKNLGTLLHAHASYVTDAGPDAWPLVICGDGPDRAALEGLARELGSPSVTFTGFLQASELATLYARAGCFVHPAIHEAWGLVVNEAMASGLPVLVSRRCGCAWDLVHEGVNGFTFDPRDRAALAGLMHRISALPSSEREFMSVESSRIVARYGVEAFADGLLAALQAAGPTVPGAQAALRA